MKYDDKLRTCSEADVELALDVIELCVCHSKVTQVSYRAVKRPSCPMKMVILRIARRARSFSPYEACIYADELRTSQEQL